jgi:hypothetical protein
MELDLEYIDTWSPMLDLKPAEDRARGAVGEE